MQNGKRCAGTLHQRTKLKKMGLELRLWQEIISKKSVIVKRRNAHSGDKAAEELKTEVERVNQCILMKEARKLEANGGTWKLICQSLEVASSVYKWRVYTTNKNQYPEGENKHRKACRKHKQQTQVGL